MTDSSPALPSPMTDDSVLRGELAPTPRGPVVTAVLGLTGISLLTRGWRLLAQLTLGLKRPAEVRLTEHGLEVFQRTELMGRVLRDRSVLVPIGNLGSVAREVRFSRVGLYAGLLSLAVGTYVGIGLVIDGLRVSGGSPSLLGLGFAIAALGLLLDFALTSAFDSSVGKCRLVVSQRRGRALAVSGLDPEVVDDFLRRVAGMCGYELESSTSGEAGGAGTPAAVDSTPESEPPTAQSPRDSSAALDTSSAELR